MFNCGAIVSELQAKGIGPGDRIGALSSSTPQFVSLFFAAWHLGAVLCPLSPRIPPAQLESHLDRLDVKLFFNGSVRPTRYPPLPHPGVLLFTSGSTGVPKIAYLSLDNLLANARGAIEVLDIRENDRYLLNLPLHHVGGIAVVLRSMLARAHCIFDPSDPEITHLSAVPTQLYRACPYYKKLRCLLIGGAPITSWPEHLPCFFSYGLTEMGSLAAIASPGAPYRPLPSTQIQLKDDGEILVRGESLFQGYWQGGAPEEWFATGDVGSIDRDGFRISGRKDWQFISGGENIQPEEIEAHLLSLPGILEAAVIPMPDPEFGMRPAAFLKASAITPDEIREALAKRLPKFKLPVSFTFLEELPKNGLKIDRITLFSHINKKSTF